MAHIDASAEQPVVIAAALSASRDVALPAGFARSREGLISFVFCGVATVAAATLCYVSFRSAMNGIPDDSRYAMLTATAVLLASCLIAFQLMLVSYRRKRVEIEQRAYERLAEAVESLRDGVSLYDPRGRLILSNAAQRRQHRHAAEDEGDDALARAGETGRQCDAVRRRQGGGDDRLLGAGIDMGHAAILPQVS